MRQVKPNKSTRLFLVREFVDGTKPEPELGGSVNAAEPVLVGGPIAREILASIQALLNDGPAATVRRVAYKLPPVRWRSGHKM